MIAVAVTAAALSCRKAPSPEPEPSDMKVRWGVEAVEGYGTRSLAGSLTDLQNFCTPAEQGGKGRKIGIWADYNITIDGRDYTVNDVFSGTQLYYNPSSSAPDTKWEYSGDAYWVPGGKYIFRAYYPAGENVDIHENSTAKVFILEYNTLKTQRDLLLAYNSYDTLTDSDYFGNDQDMSKPVKFTFRHAMAALKFIFKFYEDADPDKSFYSTDYLTSCWLEATEDAAFSIIGHVTYGDSSADEKEEYVKWFESYAPAKGSPIYKWENPEGIIFQSIKDVAKTSATAYSAAGSTGIGNAFTEHDGWLLVIPQTSHNLNLCFTTKSGGDAVFSLAIPSVTGTSVLENGTGTASATGTEFAPGWRYTYTISITKTDAQLSLGISDWNRLDSSFDISF